MIETVHSQLGQNALAEALVRVRRQARLSQAEAEWLNENVLHCGRVRYGDLWDNSAAWPVREDRILARRILQQYRLGHTAVSAGDRRQLAVCCRED